MASAFEARSALDGYELVKNRVTIKEITAPAIYSLAGSEAAWAGAAKALKVLGLALPDHGKGLSADDLSILRMSPDQCFIFASDQNQANVAPAIESLGAELAMTDQSDSWVAVEVGGEAARVALRRICPLDLNPERFEVGAVRRTSMEHLAVIIMMIQPESYVLLSPRSSAKSFIHALQLSAEYIGEIK